MFAWKACLGIDVLFHLEGVLLSLGKSTLCRPMEFLHIILVFTDLLVMLEQERAFPKLLPQSLKCL